MVGTLYTWSQSSLTTSLVHFITSFNKFFKKWASGRFKIMDVINELIDGFVFKSMSIYLTSKLVFFKPNYLVSHHNPEAKDLCLIIPTLPVKKQSWMVCSISQDELLGATTSTCLPPSIPCSSRGPSSSQFMLHYESYANSAYASEAFDFWES